MVLDLRIEQAGENIQSMPCMSLLKHMQVKPKLPDQDPLHGGHV